jgi:diguanylate cyclase (GGDEF)-like protein
LSLQSRLFVFFVGVVVIPLAIVSALARALTVGELERRTSDQLRAAGGAAAAVYRQWDAGTSPRVLLIAQDPEFQRLLLEKNYPELEGHLARRLNENRQIEGASALDYLIVADPQGSVLAQHLSESNFLPKVKPPTAQGVITPGNPESFLVEGQQVPINSPDAAAEPAANVFGGFYLDNSFIAVVGGSSGVQATFVVNEQAVASTVEAARTATGPINIPLSNELTFFKGSIAGGDVYAAPVPVAESVPIEQAALVVSTPQAPIANLASVMTLLLALFLVAATVGAVLLGVVLTRGITRPLRELAAGANAVAAGHYDQHIKVRSPDEVGQLASAFNEMAERLSIHVTQLHESREVLRRALTRFGQALRSTHNLEELLYLTVDNCMDYLRAERGLLMLLTASRDRLVVKAARGLFGTTEFELKIGEGVAGYVAEKGVALRLPDSSDVISAPQEPSFRTALVAPIYSEERVAGVVCLYEKEDGLAFNDTDLASLVSLADQAGVAIENVFLHDQARRLSITDTVVGIWNRRYFQLRFKEELERSARFGRPFSLLLLDIDDFKVVNDSYGHQRGDGVLIELTRRVKGVIRDIDVFARHGGEEFVLILPETDAEGGVATGEKIRQVVAERPFKGNPELEITVSVGVACYWQHGRDESTLEKAADQAMYEAKASGKNRVVLFAPVEAPVKERKRSKKSAS